MGVWTQRAQNFDNASALSSILGSPRRPTWVLLANRTISYALRSLALELGCPVGYLEAQRVSVLERADPTCQLLRTFVRGDIGLVSLPSPDSRAFDVHTDELQDLITMTRTESHTGSVVHMRETSLVVEDDPATLVVADHGTLRQPFQAPGCLVYDPTSAVLDMLRHEVTESDWVNGGGGMASPHRIGLLSGGVLIALASVARPIGQLARIRVLVSPSHRRRGLGRVVLQILTRNVLDQGLLPFCRFAMNDLGPRALATAVGFAHFARSLSLRVITIGSEGGVLGGPEPRVS